MSVEKNCNFYFIILLSIILARILWIFIILRARERQHHMTIERERSERCVVADFDRYSSTLFIGPRPRFRLTV